MDELIGVHRRKYIKEFKIAMVESVLQGHSIIELGKNNELFPGLIAKWKRQYLYKKFHGNSASDIELKNLKAKLCEN